MNKALKVAMAEDYIDTLKEIANHLQNTRQTFLATRVRKAVESFEAVIESQQAQPAQAVPDGWQDLIWLACKDVIFFAEDQTSSDAWSAEILCNDVFGYASADCTKLFPISAARDLRAIFEEFGWDGVFAWCAIERNEEPLKERQTPKYHEARAMLAAAPAPGGE